jgi:hypothetical protein
MSSCEDAHVSEVSAFGFSAVSVSTFEDAHLNGGFLEGAHIRRREHLRAYRLEAWPIPSPRRVSPWMP